MFFCIWNGDWDTSTKDNYKSNLQTTHNFQKHFLFLIFTLSKLSYHFSHTFLIHIKWKRLSEYQVCFLVQQKSPSQVQNRAAENKKKHKVFGIHSTKTMNHRWVIPLMVQKKVCLHLELLFVHKVLPQEFQTQQWTNNDHDSRLESTTSLETMEDHLVWRFYPHLKRDNETNRSLYNHQHVQGEALY